ncbi:MAG: voltage-gated potassium channel [Actinomycetota bacterium]|jgi:hypothetical protein|nr:voltage-gated potassium channel [Actinomycetota bacterium]
MYVGERITHLYEELRAIIRAETTTHEHFRDRLATLAMVSVVVDCAAALLAFLFEHDGAGSQIHSYGRALFWTSTQLLTVSSQIPNPVTTGGRVLDVFLELYAITVVTALAGTFATFLHHRSKERRAGRAA